MVAKDTTEADVLAKSLLIMGISEGTKFCEDNSIAAYFVDKNLNIFIQNGNPALCGTAVF